MNDTDRRHVSHRLPPATRRVTLTAWVDCGCFDRRCPHPDGLIPVPTGIEVAPWGPTDLPGRMFRAVDPPQPRIGP